MPNVTNIPAPRVPIVDPQTGLISNEWYRFLFNLFTLTGSGSNVVNLDDLQLGPPAHEWVNSSGGSGSGDVVGPATSTDNAIVRFDGTTGKLIQGSPLIVDDTGNESGVLSQQFSDGTAVTLAAGKQWYNGTTGSWNLGMGGGNITQQVGEELFRYGKASSAITDSPLQIIYKTGVVGASGQIKFAPTVAGITDPDLILGCATEPIALNAFGRITTYGVVNGITTNGTAYGEVWADGDDIWYNPVTGNPTKTKPSAPNIKVQIGTVINAGPGGSGSFIVKIGSSSALGGTDSNVQFGTLSGGQLLSYDQTAAYWKNINLTAGSGVSITSATNGAITISNSGGTGSNITTLGMWENAITISADYTITTGNNAVSAGPVTIDTGITVTVPSGSSWTVV